ncbi:hypothetical protein Tco_0844977 [Tanacetum coccineum]
MDDGCSPVTLSSGSTLLTPSFDDCESVMFFPFSPDSGGLGSWVPRMAPNVEQYLSCFLHLDVLRETIPHQPFPFLSKIVAASGGTLSDVAQILSEKCVRSATSVSVVPSSANEAPDQVPH